MKRLHVSLAVSDLEQARGFYSVLFGNAPTMERDHYVQWVLDDPAINFVIEDSNPKAGLTHLGLQVSDDMELEEQFARVRSTGARVIEQGDTQCCYAKSTKNWVFDPDGIAWETFLTHSRTEDFGQPFAALSGAQEREPADPVANERTSQTCC
ncbi:VOC family protein [Altererythrobacter sp. GH1-8]|uniref:VOC family protein n=1 Tax=Altererythrobacter sp. GH1-8 TaxID=3349333 RepID=UPI00374D1680